MASSFSALLFLDGKVYRVEWCQYTLRQYVDQRGRPRSKVRLGPIYLELWTGEVYPELSEWAASATKQLSGRLVFQRPDLAGAFVHVWFTHAYCTHIGEVFDSRGQNEQASLRLQLTIVPEQMGREAGSGEDWVAPGPREYAYVPPVAAPATVAVSANPGIPPHLPAPIPNPSPDHQQVHLSAQEWQALIKGRWDSSKKAKGKKFLKKHQQTEFHIAGDPFTYRTDKKGRMVAVYDAQKSYNITGAKNGLMGIPLTSNGQPTFAGTVHMFPVSDGQKNVVVIDMVGNRPGDFRKANEAAGLADLVKGQGRDPDQAPDGYTWHHRDDFSPKPPPNPPYGACTMELVKLEAHEDTFVHFGSCDQCNKHNGKKLYK